MVVAGRAGQLLDELGTRGLAHHLPGLVDDDELGREVAPHGVPQQPERGELGDRAHLGVGEGGEADDEQPPVERERRAAGEQVRERSAAQRSSRWASGAPSASAASRSTRSARVGGVRSSDAGSGPMPASSYVARRARSRAGRSSRVRPPAIAAASRVRAAILAVSAPSVAAPVNANGLRPDARCAEIEVRPAELVGEPAVVAQRIHREHPDPADEAAAHLGAGEHRLAGPGLAQHDRVVAGVGEPVEHDRRAARPGPAVQVPARLVQVRGGVEEAGGERRRVEVALGERPRRRTRQGRPPGVGEPERRDLELEARAPALEAHRLDPLGEARAVIAPRRAGPCRRGRSVRGPPGPRAAQPSPCRPTRSRSTSPSSPRSAASRSAARTWRRRVVMNAIASARAERPDPHRDRADAIDRQQRRQPAGLDLGRPAPGRDERRRDGLARDQPGLDPVAPPRPGDGRPTAHRAPRPATSRASDAALLGSARRARRSPAAARARSPRRAAGRSVAGAAARRRSRGRARRTRRMPARSACPRPVPPSRARCSPGSARPGPRGAGTVARCVVDGGEGLERGVPLDVSHELDAQWREL